jgi:MGT family glycosyltransferase
VTVNVIAAGRLFSPPVVGAAWNELRSSYGLSADPDCHRLGGELAITPVPRSFRDPAQVVLSSRRFVRPEIIDEVGVVRAESLVYMTLGTVFNLESGDLLERLVDAASLMETDVIVTTGPHISRDDLPRAPRHVRVEPFLPQRQVLPRCSAVVSHGGSGTVVAALALGIPVVVLPMGADQLDNADRCAELGVGIVLDAQTASAEAIARAASTALDNETYSRAATRLAVEARSQPPIGRLSELTDVLQASPRW